MNTNTSSIIVNKKTYNIIDVLGEGTSSTAYLCLDADTNAKCIVKEYDPKYIEHIKNEFGSVDVIGNRSKYSEGLSRFIDGANRQREIRNVYPNSNVDIIDCVEANNTAYIIMSFFSGASYDTFKEDTLFGVFSHIKAILVSVEQYHKLGFLHLDLKPSNVFILDGVNDLVHFFDFDSIVSKNELANSGVRISYTYDWAAPELINYRYVEDISERTDIYSVGEILFYKIFGRHSKPEEKRSFSEYDFDRAHTEYFDNIDSDIKSTLKRIFRKSICVSEKMRYSSCDEFIRDIDKALEISNPKRVYVKSSRIAANPSFMGREKEMSEIRDAMQSSVYVSLSGYGGIGKTELAKTYLINNVDEFRKVLYVSGDRSWYQVFFDIASKFMINYSDHIEDEADNRFNRIIYKLRGLLSDKDIIFIDNVSGDSFMGEEGKVWKEISSLPCHFMFTSREIIDGFYNIKIDSLDIESLMSLFCSWSEIDDYNLGHKSDIERLFELVGYHTLAVELLAKQIRNEGCTVKEKCDQIFEKGIANLKGKVIVNKDEIVNRASVFDHMNMLFSLENISEQQQKVLLDVALLPVHGVKIASLRSFIEEDDDIDELIDRGWIKRENNRISMHPLISEIVISNLKERNSYSVFLSNIKDRISKSIKNKNVDVEESSLYESLTYKLLKNVELNESICSFLDFDTESLLFIYMNKKKIVDIYTLYWEKLSKYSCEGNSKANCLCILSYYYDELDKTEDSKNYAELVITSYRDCKGDKYTDYVADAYALLINYYTRTHDFENASKYFSIVREFIEQKSVNDIILAEIYDYVGTMYYHMANPDEATYYYKKAIEIYRNNGKKLDVGVVCHNLSRVYLWNEDVESAKIFNKEAVNSYRDFYGSNGHRECVNPLFVKLDIHLAEEDYKSALETIEEIFPIINNEYDETNYYWYDIHYKYAYYYLGVRDINKAEAEIKRFLEIKNNDYLDSEIRVAQILSNYAYKLVDLEQYDLALKYLDMVLPTMENVCKEMYRYALGHIYYHYGVVYLNKNEKRLAIESLSKAKEYYKDYPEYSEQIKEIDTFIEEAKTNK